MLMLMYLFLIISCDDAKLCHNMGCIEHSHPNESDNQTKQTEDFIRTLPNVP